MRVQFTSDSVEATALRLQAIVQRTPLQLNRSASEQYQANVYFKREDLQVVRSYKIRGAFNKIIQLNEEEKKRGVVCASAGNHAQGVALSCARLQIQGTIFMPAPTPMQKVNQVQMFGGQWIEIKLIGDTFDDAFHAAHSFCANQKQTFIHPFDDPKIIAGQATVGLEIIQQADFPIDFLFLPVGGGGLAAGVAPCIKQYSPNTQIIGVEPAGAPSMTQAFAQKEVVRLSHIDKFVDGAAVKQVGQLTFKCCHPHLREMATVEEGKVCSTILELYNKDAIVVEPAGALSLAVLDQYADEIKGKNIVCILSGSNNDITRMEEIKERSLIYEGLKHYFIVRFPQRVGALKEFVMEVLGAEDDITHFEYTKKNSREKGAAVIGIRIPRRGALEPLIHRMKERGFYGNYINDDLNLLDLLI